MVKKASIISKGPIEGPSTAFAKAEEPLSKFEVYKIDQDMFVSCVISVSALDRQCMSRTGRLESLTQCQTKLQQQYSCKLRLTGVQSKTHGTQQLRLRLARNTLLAQSSSRLDRALNKSRRCICPLCSTNHMMGPFHCNIPDESP